MESKALKILSVTEYNLIANKDPRGSYDRQTRNHLYEVIKKLYVRNTELSPLEVRLRKKFYKAKFIPIEEKEKKVKREVIRYRLSVGVKKTIRFGAAMAAALLVAGFLVYEFALDRSSRQQVDLAYYSGLRKIGIDTNPDIEKIKKDLKIASTKLEKVQQDKVKIQEDLTVASSRLDRVQKDKLKFQQDLTIASSQLEKVQQEKRKLDQVIGNMVLNNKNAENLKYVIRKIYGHPQTKYVVENDTVTLNFNDKKIASFSRDPDLWYLLGIIESGVTRVFYDDQEILEIETIFGRKGEETPLGEYEIKNRLHNPTWFKKETINGETKVRPIPFGDPDHEIGHWWLGLKTLDKSVKGSYGIHGVNAGKVNDFFKKNFDWRNGSAGCLNIQKWYLEFLAKTVPLGVKVNIVKKDKWNKKRNLESPFAA